MKKLILIACISFAVPSLMLASEGKTSKNHRTQINKLQIRLEERSARIGRLQNSVQRLTKLYAATEKKFGHVKKITPIICKYSKKFNEIVVYLRDTMYRLNATNLEIKQSYKIPGIIDFCLYPYNEKMHLLLRPDSLVLYNATTPEENSNRKVELWRISKPQDASEFKKIVIQPDVPKTLYIGHTDGNVSFYQTKNPPEFTKTLEFDFPLHSLCFSGNYLLLLSQNGKVSSWNTISEKITSHNTSKGLNHALCQLQPMTERYDFIAVYSDFLIYKKCTTPERQKKRDLERTTNNYSITCTNYLESRLFLGTSTGAIQIVDFVGKEEILRQYDSMKLVPLLSIQCIDKDTFLTVNAHGTIIRWNYDTKTKRINEEASKQLT